MKIFISIIILSSLALLIKKFGAKNIAQEIEDKAAEAAASIRFMASGANNNNTDSNSTNNELKKDTTQLDADKASLTALQNDTGNKDLLKRIGILQAQNKWGVKDENGFYYSVDSTGVVFSGGNSTDEYNTMLQQQTDYNTKVAALTKTISDETSTENKPVAKAAGKVNGLEIPLEIKLLISTIKSKLGLKSVDENEDNGNENSNTDNDDADYQNNYNNGGNNNGGDNGGGGGNNNNNPYPFANTILPTAATSILPTGATLANILSQPIHATILPHTLNFPPINITPIPVINNPVIANAPASSARQTINHRHSGHYYHNHRRY
jgi:hypothetical protein